MKIAINTLSVTHEKFGIKTFLISLIDGFLNCNQKNIYILLCSSFNRDLFVKYQENENIIIEDVGNIGESRIDRILFDQIKVQEKLEKCCPDIYFVPSNISTVSTLPSPRVSMFATSETAVICDTCDSFSKNARSSPESSVLTTKLLENDESEPGE